MSLSTLEAYDLIRFAEAFEARDDDVKVVLDLQ